MKRCSHCKEVKPLADFYKTKTNKDGLSYLCKICSRAVTQKYRATNGEQYSINQKKRRATEDVFITNLLCGAKRRAEDKNLPYELSREFIKERLEKLDGKCEVTGLPMTFESKDYHERNYYRVSLDRIDSSLGYTLANTRLVCWAVNQMKNSMTEEVFHFWINSVHKAISSQA